MRIVGALVSGIVVSSLKGGWRKVTGEAPPKANDLDVPVKKTLLWAMVSAMAVAGVEVLAARAGAKRSKSFSNDEGVGAVIGEIES